MSETRRRVVLTARGLRRRGGPRGPRRPGAALVWCTAVGLVTALAWSFVVPPFEAPDEPQHFAYAEYLARTGQAPKGGRNAATFSPREAAALQATRFDSLHFNVRGRPPWTAGDERALRAVLDRPASSTAGGGDSTAINNPPLYYALEAIPYYLAASGNALDQLALMRVLSAVLAAITVAFTFLFLRECFPRLAWAAPVGALAVALQPMFGFLGGSVNNDNALFAASAALFWLLARMWRRGLTPRLAAAIGGVAGVALLAKLTALGLLPGVALGLLLGALRAGAGVRRRVLRELAIAGAAFLAPVALYVLVSRYAWDRSLFATAAAPAHAPPVSVRGFLSYVWQFYLPRLPFQQRYFGDFPLWRIWIEGFVGRFGWQDTELPQWVYTVVGGVLIALAAAAGVALERLRAGLRRRGPEVLTYAAMTGGLLLFIALAGYRYLLYQGEGFEQARYLLVLLPLYGAIVVLAARAFGRRFAHPAGSAIVTLAVGHALFAILFVAGRYYG